MYVYTVKISRPCRKKYGRRDNETLSESFTAVYVTCTVMKYGAHLADGENAVTFLGDATLFLNVIAVFPCLNDPSLVLSSLSDSQIRAWLIIPTEENSWELLQSLLEDSLWFKE
jgi:hypothetical protein